MAAVVETLEQRRLMAGVGTSAAVAEDLLIVHADRQRIHFDRVQLRTVARDDRRNAQTTTGDDRKRISDDLRRLHIDQRSNPNQITTDLVRLESDEQTLANDLRATSMIVGNDRALVWGQLQTDRATLGNDLRKLAADRSSGEASHSGLGNRLNGAALK